jgi:hypothetical protein
MLNRDFISGAEDKFMQQTLYSAGAIVGKSSIQEWYI